VAATITEANGGGPIPNGTRNRIEAHLGVDLGNVKVNSGSSAAAAAADLGARAFTYRQNIFLGSGESATDLGLMAHESVHVLQQGAAAVQRDALQRKVSGADLPGAGFVIEAVQAIPGYLLMSQIIGEDLITGEPVTASRAEFVQTLLGYGHFAGAVGPVLQAIDALDGVFALIRSRLAEHNLTLSRIERDIAAAWDEMKLIEGVDYNVAIAERYLNAVITDIRGFVDAIVSDVIAAVRTAAVSFAEPLVQKPEIKPYWDLGIKVFHYDPLKGEPVSAPTVEILSDFLRLIGKETALAEMQQHGTLQQTADWLDTQFGTFNSLLAQATALFADAWAAIAPENLPNLVSNIESLVSRAFALLQQVGSFAQTVITQVLVLVKQALLGLLSLHAHKVPGFHLLTVILGRNPFTGEPVTRNAENLIKGFITLLPNGEQMYAELAQSGVIADAGGRIEAAITELNISWDLITGTFRAIWDGLSLEDLLDPIGAFERIIGQFGEPLNRIISFVGRVIGVVVELILKLMNFPTELLGNIIANAMAAIEDITRDPIGFLKNVVLAMKQGFIGFLDKIGQYLLQGLTDWVLRALRGIGIELPANLSLETIITLVLQVLGISVETLWTKLGKKIGPERVAQIRSAIDKAGQAWAFVKDVEERGISGIWEFISGQLGNLWDMILQKAKDWIMTEIINKVAAKLLSMLDPTGIMAVINGCIAFFNAIQSAVEYLRDILQIIDGYVSTIASAARGDVTPGAARLEQSLASAIPVAIGFLANQVGLSNVPEKIVEIIKGLKELIDKALDWLFEQAWKLGQAALRALGLGEEKGEAEDSTGVKAVARQDLATAAANPITTKEAMQEILDQIMERRRPEGLKSLEIKRANDLGHFTVFAEASPSDPIGDVLNHFVEAAPDSVIEMALDAVSGETHCFAEFSDGESTELVHYQNDPGGLHAEQKFINDLDVQLASFPTDAMVDVRIKLNRLPCRVCAPALDWTASKKSKRMALRISVTAIYGGTRLTAWLIEGDRVRMKPDKYIKAKEDQILRLMNNPAVTVDVWDIWEVISDDLEDDERLFGLDPGLVKRNLRASDQLRGYLEYVKKNVGPTLAGMRSQ
jgi:hypothetical protein